MLVLLIDEISAAVLSGNDGVVEKSVLFHAKPANNRITTQSNTWLLHKYTRDPH